MSLSSGARPPSASSGSPPPTPPSPAGAAEPDRPAPVPASTADPCPWLRRAAPPANGSTRPSKPHRHRLQSRIGPWPTAGAAVDAGPARCARPAARCRWRRFRCRCCRSVGWKLRGNLAFRPQRGTFGEPMSRLAGLGPLSGPTSCANYTDCCAMELARNGRQRFCGSAAPPRRTNPHCLGGKKLEMSTPQTAPTRTPQFAADTRDCVPRGSEDHRDI
jgi:hypothetical protein